MKRLHLHIAVDNLQQSIGFYSTLFGAKPVKQKPDYAKWMLEDPKVNFAISARGVKPGLDHMGIQVETSDELATLRDQLKRADLGIFNEGEVSCCYAESDKSWVQDPSGIAWEVYHTMADAEIFNKGEQTEGVACCVPKVEKPKVDKGTCAPKGSCC